MQKSKPESRIVELTGEIKAKLAIFHRVGVASADRFADAPLEYHPQNLLNDFQSIIGYAQGKHDESSSHMGQFDNQFETIAAQDDVLQYLHGLGFKAALILPTDGRVSLPRIGQQAGTGELSPVNSLQVEGYGLNSVIGAIITDAPLTPDPLVSGLCTECMGCLEFCPAASEPYKMDGTQCTSCGECIAACPL